MPEIVTFLRRPHRRSAVEDDRPICLTYLGSYYVAFGLVREPASLRDFQRKLCKRVEEEMRCPRYGTRRTRAKRAIFWVHRYRCFLYSTNTSSFSQIPADLPLIMPTERELTISPIVQESVQHNTKVQYPPLPPLPWSFMLRSNMQVISNIRTLTASLFGIASGILGLESYGGFLFYLLGTFFVSGLIYAILAKQDSKAYFQNAWSELWAGDVLGGGLSFILTWTLFYGLCTA